MISFENIGRRVLSQVKNLSITSFQHGVLESRLHGCLRTHPARLDAGYPCRHDEISFSFSVGEPKIMEHFAVSALSQTEKNRI
jgi:hypothetical protein